MRDHTDCFRAYSRPTKAWYAHSLRNEDICVHFGMYHPHGGTSGEMTMQWLMLAGELVPELCCFSDGWSALSLFTDLISELANFDDVNITEAEFVEILDKCGFKDLTPYTNETNT